MFEVGKKYRPGTENPVFSCLSVFEKGGKQWAWLYSEESTQPFTFVWSTKWEEYTPPPKMVKKTGWMNVYPEGGHSTVYNTKVEADEYHGKSRLYCTEVSWEEPENAL